MKIKVTVATSAYGSHVEEIIEVPDDVLEGMKGMQREYEINEYALKWMWKNIYFDWSEVEE